MKKAIFVAALMSVWAVVAVFAASSQKYDVEISLREKRILDLTPKGLSLVFHLDIYNTLAAPLSLTRYDYRVVINETEFLNLQTSPDEPILVEPKTRLLIALPIKVTYEYLFQAVPDVQAKDKATCYLAGGIVFQDEKKKEKRVPVAFSGDFPIYRGLEIQILPVEAKDLTVGGANLVFKAALKNPNGFSFKIDRATYKLDFAGKTVSEGVVGEGIAVESRGESAFVIPLLLDFFEVGKVVYDGLEQPPVAVSFSGEIEFSSPWGSFKIPFHKSDKVAVQRIP